MPSLEHRARMHAALGEPVRLAIVEKLTVGDAAPSELGRLFALPTNLVAHHLRVLDEAGLVRRLRSQGDKRRCYVQLVLDNPAVTELVETWQPTELTGLAGPVRPTARVVFVCSENSARSQLAAAAWAKASDVPTASAGTHPVGRVHPRAIDVGRRHGLLLAQAGTAQLDDVVRCGDLVVAVCDQAYEELPAAEQPKLHWAMPDPARLDTDEAFEAACRQITQRVARLAAAL